MIAGFLAALHAFRLRRAIAGVRENMAALGFSIDDLTDEQVVNRVRRIDPSGVSAERAAAGFAAMGAAFANADGKVRR
jgi:hypothetical protein